TWRFIGPDGGEEEVVYPTLHACEVAGSCGTEIDPNSEYSYSRSGGFTRMYAPVGNPNSREIHVRDGTVYEFTRFGGPWRLTRIRDPWLSGGQPQNWVEIDYASEAPDWVITDSVGRTHRVLFANRPY